MRKLICKLLWHNKTIHGELAEINGHYEMKRQWIECSLCGEKWPLPFNTISYSWSGGASHPTLSVKG